MYERDTRAVRAGAGRLVEQPDAAGPEPLQDGLEIVDEQRDVVDAGTTPVEEARDDRVGCGWLQQFQCRPADGHEGRADALRRDIVRYGHLQPERVAIERQRLVEI